MAIVAVYDETVRQTIGRDYPDADGFWAMLLHKAIGIDGVVGPEIGQAMLLLLIGSANLLAYGYDDVYACAWATGAICSADVPANDRTRVRRVFDCGDRFVSFPLLGVLNGSA